MGHQNLFYLKEVYFKSVHKDWHAKYLTSREDRITSILQNKLKNDFWENYASVRLRFEKDSLLLLRIKSITEDAVCFSQVWRSEEVAEKFRDEALRGIDMMALLRESGVDSKEIISTPNETEILSLIGQIRQRPHIVQVIHKDWRTPDMAIGDPLKRGKLYLPFPT